MKMPTALKSLDDKVLGRRGERAEAAGDPYPDEPQAEQPGTVRREVVEHRPAPGAATGEGLRELLGVVYRISRLVFLALAAALVVGIVFVLAPTNGDNSVVQLVGDVANGAAGPFRDVFTVSDADREVVLNYGFAAAVYLVAALLVTKLPGGKR